MTPELRELLKCPLDWTKVTNRPFEGTILEADWQYAIGATAPDPDDIPFEDILEVYDYDDEEIERAVEVLKDRQCETREFYKTKCAYRLYDLNFMTPVQQAAKHAVKKLDESQILSGTKRGPSIFLRSLDSAYLRQQFWDWLICYFDAYADRESYHFMMDPDDEIYNDEKAKLWRGFLSQPHTRFSWRFDQPIGASRGALTSFVCYDIHLDTKAVHCFPVPEAEATEIMGDAPLVTSDEFCRPADL